ncbi:zinc ribbon domain-containing protein [Roseiflexus castenholzii]|uniref:zinc ribbon domain-containing protein n=1 Tax=Roseiflexus castenholzii TaxID=120962 RepID=UPI003C7A750F
MRCAVLVRTGPTCGTGARGEPVQTSLSVRTHICPHCGYGADRDVNAAQNILTAGAPPSGTPADGLAGEPRRCLLSPAALSQRRSARGVTDRRPDARRRPQRPVRAALLGQTRRAAMIRPCESASSSSQAARGIRPREGRDAARRLRGDETERSRFTMQDAVAMKLRRRATAPGEVLVPAAGAGVPSDGVPLGGRDVGARSPVPLHKNHGRGPPA